MFDGSSVTEQSLARTYLEVVQAGARHGVVFPSEMLLQAKALVTMEALCLYLAPEFRFSEELRPIVARRLAERVSPAALVDRLWEIVPDLCVTGELFYTERDSAPSEVEPAFRREALTAIAESWSDGADSWLRARRGERWLAHNDRPELAALVELAVQVSGLVGAGRAAGAELNLGDPAELRWAAFQHANRAESPRHTGSWRVGRPWVGASAAALLPVARVVLARSEAALREQQGRPNDVRV
ncbi:MAG: hypothetical protein IPI67_24130 [Myxococcales bacterium]|nr:hypothetical protein [Myxococcales bacterium]